MGDIGVRFAGVLNAGVRAEGWLVAVLVALVVSVVITVLVAAMLLACAPVVSQWLPWRRRRPRQEASVDKVAVAATRRGEWSVVTARLARRPGYRLTPILSGLAVASLLVVGVVVTTSDPQTTRLEAAGQGPSMGPAPSSSTTTTATVAQKSPRPAAAPRRTSSATTTTTVETIPGPYIPDADDALTPRRASTRPRTASVSPPTTARRPPTTWRPPTTTRSTTTTRPRTPTTVRPLQTSPHRG